MTKLIRKLFSRVPSWKGLKALGNSKAIKTSYFWFIFVPVMARLFTYTSENVNVTIFEYKWALNFQLPFSWQIFFYSSCAFALASFIFQISCPAAIKKYDSFKEWEDNGKDTDSLIKGMWMLLHSPLKVWPYEIPLKRFKEFVREFTSYNDKIDEARICKSIPHKLVYSGIQDGKLKGAFFCVLDQYSNIKPIQRAVCTLLYSIGFILLFYIIYENVEYVINYSNLSNN